MNTALLWAALQIAGASAVGANPLPSPTVLTLPSVGQLVLTESPSPDLTAVRVFVPISERSGEAGAGRVILALATERVRGLAARSGVHFATARIRGGAVYTASGSDFDVDQVFAVIAQALSEPRNGPMAVRQASEPLLRELENASETGRGWVTATLARQVCSETAPWSGSVDDLNGLNERRLQALWSRTHAAPRLVVTVASSLPRPVVFAGVDLLRTQLSRDSAAVDVGAQGTARTTPAPRVLRHWYGAARTLPLGDPAAAAVLGEFLESALRVQSEGFELFADLRDTPCGPALFIVGSALPNGAGAMRNRVRTFLAELATTLDDRNLASATSAIRLRLLMAADTPGGRAAAVASTFEGRTDVGGLLVALSTLGSVDVAAFLADLSAVEPMSAEVRR